MYACEVLPIFASDYHFSATYGCPRPEPADLIPLSATKLFSYGDRLEERKTLRLDVGPSDDPIVSLGYFRPQARIVDPVITDKAELSKNQDAIKANVERLRTNSAKSKLVHFRDERLIEVILEGRDTLVSPAQPFGDDRYLLKNAVVGRDGVTIHRLELGFGLETIQTTLARNIWTHYGDQEVFDDHPFGRKIVACFDSDGKHLYPDDRYEEFEHWCTALNVESEHSVWFAPSMGALVQVENFSIKRVTQKQRTGSGVFAIHEEHALWAPFEYHMMAIDFFVASNLKTSANKFYQAVDDKGNRLNHEHYAARGSRMYFTANDAVYVIDLKNVQL